MIETNVPGLFPELLEQSKFFHGAEDLSVQHFSSVTGETFHNEVTVNGRKFSFDNAAAYANALEKKRYEKRFAKLAFYRAASAVLGETLPWGALTGIRPVKFSYREGDRWREIMRDEMGVSEKKLDLVGRIRVQQEPFYRTKPGDADLFIGIPFCPTRCSYCSFVSQEIGKCGQIPEYVDCLVKEINAAKRLIGSLRSVYIGGGTPVSLPVGQLERILDAVRDPGVEFTVEAGRPDCIDDEKLSLLKEAGVTRICVNPQTFHDKTLVLLGRKHTVRDILEKYESARKFGFSVNMDLIAGLPGESLEDFRASVDKAADLSPDNVTVHTLSLKKGSRLKESVDRLPDGEIGVMIDYSAEKLLSSGYEPYYLYRQKYMAGNLENTGYAKPGKGCAYNVDVMEEITDNVACGANAVSKKLFGEEDRIERYGAPKDVPTYLSKIDRIIAEKERLFTGEGRKSADGDK
ncbi:MAG: coproporphyrinogen dehydrogenase HemZ [Candidatus Borkfalkiaceae bacterium]|nr:coproporphyrinogen dehydrogenase HemZ [Christensenellaceae bacterium]